MFIVLLGAPGSGKGTAGKIIAEDLKLAHISTGDLFRENLKNETELGKEAKQYIRPYPAYDNAAGTSSFCPHLRNSSGIPLPLQDRKLCGTQR